MVTLSTVIYRRWRSSYSVYGEAETNHWKEGGEAHWGTGEHLSQASNFTFPGARGVAASESSFCCRLIESHFLFPFLPWFSFLSFLQFFFILYLFFFFSFLLHLFLRFVCCFFSYCFFSLFPLLPHSLTLLFVLFLFSFCFSFSFFSFCLFFRFFLFFSHSFFFRFLVFIFILLLCFGCVVFLLS